MKRTLVALCAASLLLGCLTTPVLGAYIGDVRPRGLPLPVSGEAPPRAPDKAGTVSFELLETRLRERNPMVRSLQAALNSYTIVDRERAYKNLVDAINDMADYAWAFKDVPGVLAQASATITALEEQLEALKPENYEKSMELLNRQMGDAMWQIIAGAEELYLTILSYEANRAELDRALSSLETTVVEMSLRHTLGQVSALTLQQLQATLQSTRSQAASLEQGIRTMKASLETLLGEPVAGDITLSPLPAPSQAQLALEAQDYALSLEAAKAKSATLYAADRTLEDAREDWDDVAGIPSVLEKYKVAEQTYQSAVFTHTSTVQSFELSFRALYEALPSARQALVAARSTLSYQQEAYRAMELRHQLGQLSDTALHTAKDDLLSTQAAAETAQRNLFAAYRQFERAVVYGLVN